MTAAEKDKLVEEWIEFQSVPLPERSRDFRKKHQLEGCWADEKLSDACRHNPELAWELILRIHNAEHNQNVTIMLAAGALEDLLATYGEHFIDRVEIQARKNPKFRYLLGGVWQNSMTEEVWKRVQAVRGEIW